MQDKNGKVVNKSDFEALYSGEYIANGKLRREITDLRKTIEIWDDKVRYLEAENISWKNNYFKMLEIKELLQKAIFTIYKALEGGKKCPLPSPMYSLALNSIKEIKKVIFYLRDDDHSKEDILRYTGVDIEDLFDNCQAILQFEEANQKNSEK